MSGQRGRREARSEGFVIMLEEMVAPWMGWMGWGHRDWESRGHGVQRLLTSGQRVGTEAKAICNFLSLDWKKKIPFCKY